jgi:hypothetical protein
MALPIKPKDTQEGCNPISSNCVVWQGPDIPCINLCNGDSVSDVVAKLAEEICTIVDQLDISLIDISCFGALAPEPKDFRDVVQLLIDRICNLEAGSTGGGTVSTGGCPDNCLVPVAQCLQYNDPLGNTVTELALRDYLILVANRLCTLISQVNTLSSAVTDLQNRVTVIEQDLANPTDNSIIITSGGCIGNGIPTLIEAFVVALESELCRFIASVGTAQEITNAIARQCTPNNTSLDDAAQLSNPTSSMANIPGWAAAASYTTLADAVNNLWLTVCDMRVAITDLQTQLAACCSASCDDTDWNFTATGITNVKFLTLYFAGNIPSTFTYCSGGTTTPITVLNSLGQLSSSYNYDVVTAINSGAPLQLDLNVSSVSEYALWYRVTVPVCVTNGSITCSTTHVQEFYDTSWCTERAFTLSSTNVVPNTSGTLQLNWNGSGAATTYQLKLFLDNGNPTPVQIGSTASVLAVAGAQSYAFPGTYGSGDTYFVEITSIQTGGNGAGLHSLDCTTSVIAVAS